MKSAIVALMMGLLVITTVPQPVYAAGEDLIPAENTEVLENGSGSDTAELSGSGSEESGVAENQADDGDSVIKPDDATDHSEVINSNQDPESSSEANGENKEDAPVVEEAQYQDAVAPLPSVVYQAHIQSDGWQSEVKDGAKAGTTGQSKRVEALKIRIDGDEDLGISYQVHVQNYGWMKSASDGAQAGTTGQSKRVEAVKIWLTGANAENYDIYYCTHIQNFGWLNWVKDGEESGTTGLAYRVEAIEIKLVEKGGEAPSNLGSLSMGSIDPGSIVNYRVHVQNIGWMGTVSNGAVAGTTGQSRRVEAISISFTGQMDQFFDVYYRAHIQNIGWTGWAKNGANCGSQGKSLQMEALQIQVVPKGAAAPGSTANTFYQHTIRDDYPQACAVLDQVGWNLQAAFNWSAGLKWVKSPTDPALGSRYFANLGFTNHQGNCYVMAGTFYEMAKALGYDAHQMTGTVPLRRGGMGPHSWVEVNISGTYYVFDPDFTNESKKNGYMIYYGQSGTWRYTGYSRMN